jgi:hypothetical protein
MPRPRSDPPVGIRRINGAGDPLFLIAFHLDPKL